MPYGLLSSSRLTAAKQRRRIVREMLDNQVVESSRSSSSGSASVPGNKKTPSSSWWPSGQPIPEQERPTFWWGETLEAPFEQPTMLLRCALKTKALLPARAYSDVTQGRSSDAVAAIETERENHEDGAAWQQFGDAPHAAVRFAIFKSLVRDALSAASVEYVWVFIHSTRFFSVDS